MNRKKLKLTRQQKEADLKKRDVKFKNNSSYSLKMELQRQGVISERSPFNNDLTLEGNQK